MMMKKSKSSFFISTDSEPDTDTDSDYEEGDCFDLLGTPIFRIPKKEICDKICITHYILFFTIMTLFGYILYRTMTDLYTDE